MSPEVLCIGHAAYDMSLFVDRFPAENAKAETGDWMESGGGPAANAAYLLASWGTGSAFAGWVGDDVFGRSIRAEMEAAGVDCSLLQTRLNHATPFSVILVNTSNGSRTIVNRKDRGGALSVDSAMFDELAPGVMLFDGHEPAASLAALAAFPDAVSILDAGSWREGTAELAGKVDYLVASERFARHATGLDDIRDRLARRRCVDRLRERFRTAVVVTLGEEGLVADDGSGFRHLPAFPATAVDTTGAGDVFHGAFAHAVARSMPIGEGLRFASMAASLSVRARGGRGSIPVRSRVEEALAHAG